MTLIEPIASPRLLEDVNDVHSAMNAARMSVDRPGNVEDLRALLASAARDQSPVSICGGRHAMGGQQFANRGRLIDTSRLDRVLSFDTGTGVIHVQAGIQWPALLAEILRIQLEQSPGMPPRWGIAQKQTGADALSIGGALSANAHGRGLMMGPIVEQIESFMLITSAGEIINCSRAENAELFSLAIGGYGLFGVIAEVKLRLAPRRTLRRVVRVIDIDDAIPAAQRCIDKGFLYGDFQFDIDPCSPAFLTKGVMSAYCPVDGDPTPPSDQRALSDEDWVNLLTLAHSDKTEGFNRYAQHYLATDGQLYESDTHQLSYYSDHYHRQIEQRLGLCCGSEMITELYVPPERLIEFLHAAAAKLIELKAEVIYGTIRLIQPDRDTFLPWAPDRRACIVLNLHVDHTAAAIDRAGVAFGALIDIAADLGGSFYLTYHRFASPAQVERCYPRIREFFSAKRRHDPEGLFESDWYRHYAPHFS